MVCTTVLFCPAPVIDSKPPFESQEIFDRLAKGEDPPRDGTPES